MHVYDVEAVGSDPGEAGLDAAQNTITAPVETQRAVGFDQTPDFGRQHKLLARNATQSTAQALLAQTGPIHRRGIKKCDATPERLMYCGDRLPLRNRRVQPRDR